MWLGVGVRKGFLCLGHQLHGAGDLRTGDRRCFRDAVFLIQQIAVSMEKQQIFHISQHRPTTHIQTDTAAVTAVDVQTLIPVVLKNLQIFPVGVRKLGVAQQLAGGQIVKMQITAHSLYSKAAVIPEKRHVQNGFRGDKTQNSQHVQKR